MKIDLGCTARRNVYLLRVKELDRGIASLIAAAGQRQGLVLDYLPGSAKANKSGDQHDREAEHLFAPSGQGLLYAGLDFIL